MATILIIEGDSALRALYGAKLTALGHAVALVGTAKDGQAEARSLSPDLMVVDLDLDDSMDGLTLLRDLSIHPKTRNSLIVASSRNDDEEMIRQAFSLGAIDFMSRVKTTPAKQVAKIVAVAAGLKVKPGSTQRTEILKYVSADKPVSAGRGIKKIQPSAKFLAGIDSKVKKFASEIVAQSKPADQKLLGGQVMKTIERELKIKELIEVGLPRGQAEQFLAQKSPRAEVLISSEDDFFGRLYRLKLETAGIKAYQALPAGFTQALTLLKPKVALLDVKYPKALAEAAKSKGSRFVFMANNRKECGSSRNCYVRAETTPARLVQEIKRQLA